MQSGSESTVISTKAWWTGRILSGLEAAFLFGLYLREARLTNLVPLKN
jgi:hypothetical protein